MKKARRLMTEEELHAVFEALCIATEEDQHKAVLHDASKPANQLEVSYDSARDELTIDGLRFSGEIFRTWNIPTDRIYQFSRDGDKVIIQQVIPCEECRRQFHLYD